MPDRPTYEELEQRLQRLEKAESERKTAIEALQESKYQYRSLLDKIQAAVVVHDADTKIIASNAKAFELLGLKEDQILGKTGFDIDWKFFRPDKKPMPIEEYPVNHVIATQQSLKDYTCGLYRPSDLDLVWVIVNADPVFDDMGKIQQVIVTFVDITERKRNEEALKESTKTLKNILEKAADGICVCYNISEWPYVRFTHWNPRIVEITGYSIEEINRLGWYQSLYPDTEVQQKASERMSRMRQGNDIMTEEWVITTKDGNLKTIHISTSILKENNGETHVLALIQDVSERKRYEEQLIYSRKEWEEIFQAIGHPTVILGPDHNIIAANKAALNISGLDEYQIKNKKCCEIFHNTDRPPESCPMEALLNKGDLETVEMEMEALDGTFLVSCTPITNKEGHLEKIIHIATDITDKKNLEAKLRQSHKMEAIGTLAGGIAHDFNNILYMIIGNAELALKDIPQRNPVHNNLEEIKAAGQRAAGIVKLLLNFSHKIDIELKSTCAVTIIKDALKFLRSTIPPTIEIRDHLPETEAIMLADPIRIHLVLMNICTNAAQAMEEAGGILDINVEIESLTEEASDNYPELSAGDYVKIVISDNGPGINPEIIDRIFDPYFTTKDFGKNPGMGLAMVRGIVKNHNGAIAVNSSPGIGTTFSILFPIAVKKPVMEFKAPDELLHGNETILFVDDEESITYMTQQILEHLGYTVESKLNPLEALDLFKSKPDQFDLVITDMTMPQMSGVSLFKELKRVRSDIRVIICSGYSSVVNEETAKEQGIDAFVMKPIMMADIAKTIRRVLKNKQSSSREDLTTS